MRLYTTPLKEDQYTNLILYHAYVVFNTETDTGTYWSRIMERHWLFRWAEILKMWEIKLRAKGALRFEKYPNYWQPSLNTDDSSSISLSELCKYMTEDTDQLNSKYNFSDENCKKFAKIVFDKIARNKTWNYAIWYKRFSFKTNSTP